MDAANQESKDPTQLPDDIGLAIYSHYVYEEIDDHVPADPTDPDSLDFVMNTVRNHTGASERDLRRYKPEIQAFMQVMREAVESIRVGQGQA